METELFFNDFTGPAAAFPADYSGLLMEDNGLQFNFNPYNYADNTDYLMLPNEGQYQAPDHQDLAEFFSSDNFFGEPQASNEGVDSALAITQNMTSSDGAASNSDAYSNYVDSTASSSPMSNADSIASVTNMQDDDLPQPIAKKRRQNREAAKRYRMKKKTVSHAIVEEEKALEMANADLRQNIDRLEAKLAVIKDILRHQYGFPEDSDILLVQIA